MAIKIKRGTQITFEAKDDAEALRTARDRLGPDAVILSSRQVKTGGFLGLFRRTVLQVSAAVLEEDRRSESDAEKKERLAAFQKLLEIKQAMASPGEGVSGSESTVLDGIAFRGDQVSPPASIPPPKVKKVPIRRRPERRGVSPKGLALASEKRLRRLNRGKVSGKLQTKSRNARSRLVLNRLETEREPAPPPPPSDEGKDILAKLLAADVSETHARSLVERFRDDPQGRNFLQWLGKKISVAAQESWEALGGRKVMLIGPTGVGKTTTIAKLAAIHSLWKKKKVFLLTADTYRIAAVKQVETYSKILGIPMDVVDDPRHIGPVLEKTAGADLVLLDTAGRSQRDGARIEEMRALYLAFQPDAVHLVLAANMKYRDMLDVVKRMGVVPISRVIFTKPTKPPATGTSHIPSDLTAPSPSSPRTELPTFEVASGMRLPNAPWRREGNRRCLKLKPGTETRRKTCAA